jgi:hypothetical protein
MHQNTTIFIPKKLLHVSTLLGHLQGEYLVTLLDALIQLTWMKAKAHSHLTVLVHPTV